MNKNRGNGPVKDEQNSQPAATTEKQEVFLHIAAKLHDEALEKHDGLTVIKPSLHVVIYPYREDAAAAHAKFGGIVLPVTSDQLKPIIPSDGLGFIMTDNAADECSKSEACEFVMLDIGRLPHKYIEESHGQSLEFAPEADKWVNKLVDEVGVRPGF